MVPLRESQVSTSHRAGRCNSFTSPAACGWARSWGITDLFGLRLERERVDRLRNGFSLAMDCNCLTSCGGLAKRRRGWAGALG